MEGSGGRTNVNFVFRRGRAWLCPFGRKEFPEPLILWGNMLLNRIFTSKSAAMPPKYAGLERKPPYVPFTGKVVKYAKYNIFES
jgi:hypothetical protein